MPLTSPTGTFTFKHTPFGSPSFNTFWAILRATTFVAVKSASGVKSHNENATEGTSNTQPSIAAATVPE